MAGVRNGIVYSEEYMSYKYHFEWDVYGQDDQGRKIVRWKLVSDSSGSYSRCSMSIWAYDANGQNLKNEGIAPWKSAYTSGEIIDSGDFICPLDTYQIAIEGSCYINAGIGLSIAGIWELTTDYVPSPSTIACSTAAIGQAPTIAITKKDVDTYVTITYTFGTLTGTVVEGYAGSAYTGWIIPDTFYNEMPDVSSKKGTMTATSYRNGVMTGSESCQFTVKVDADECAPTITATIVDTNATTTAITQDNTFFIKGYSDATITVTATANMGSSISSYYINNNGRVATTQTATFNGVTSGSFVITVTDARGVSATTTVNIDLIDYTRVTCVVAATPPTTEGTTTITVSGRYFPRALGYTNNTLTVQYRRWRHGDTVNEDWYTVTPTVENGVYEAELPFSDLDYKSAYTFEAVATDLLSEETSSVSVKTVPVFSWSNDDFEFNVPVNVVGEIETDGLEVVGPTTLNGTNEIKGTTEISGTLDVKSDTMTTKDINAKNITASGDVSCDDLTVGGNATVAGDITITDKITAGRMQITGDVSFDSDMTFNGITAKKASTFQKNVDFEETTTFGETATFNGDVTVNGTLTYNAPYKDYIIERGSKGMYPSTTADPYVNWTWTYAKYASGYVECWGRLTDTAIYSNEKKSFDVPFPITFANTNYYLVVSARASGAYSGTLNQAALIAYEGYEFGTGDPRKVDGTQIIVYDPEYYDTDSGTYGGAYNLSIHMFGWLAT